MLNRTVEALRRRGFEAIAVATGEEALAQVMAEVAAATGFASATRFSQAFSQALGISPSAYREREGKRGELKAES